MSESVWQINVRCVKGVLGEGKATVLEGAK